MSKDILNLEPKAVWQHFYDFTQIPRPSKKERKAAEHVLAFGKKLGLFAEQDQVGNVLIRKPATKGMENRKGIILQGHLDMVPQKNSDKQHDFEKDPIDAYIDGDWVRARGTTLGADNGIGAAAAMAVLESTAIAHPQIEALFTIDEETGMTGAFAIQPGWLTGDILINLDSEDEGELCVGCAGGLDGSFLFKYEEQAPAAGEALQVIISGLKGGHSGVDIALGRANANKLVARIAKRLTDKLGVQLASLEGGNMRNAIPREASMTFVTDKAAQVKAEVEVLTKEITEEYALEDNAISIKLESAQAPQKVMSAASQKNILNAIMACPNGVVRMSDTIPGLVETSNNLAIVRVADGAASISCLMRSSVDSAKIYLSECMEAVFTLAGAQSAFTGGYPGWKPNPSSAILEVMSKLYERMFNQKPHVRAIHAGLECGLLGGAYPSWDMISFGPTILNPHSPDERVQISTVEKWWKYLVEILKNAPAK
ncbi:MAG: aminoacyl-histidine dipeptidase [Prevotellaceae bacterium]|jgi:dipeptidase D|nr:aminoacyl-histidine dipeptidase [Prevotellaceae bacterium]